MPRRLISRRAFLQRAAAVSATLAAAVPARLLATWAAIRAGPARAQPRPDSETDTGPGPLAGTDTSPGAGAQPAAASAQPVPLTLFLAGDVMLGRGFDQALPHPGDPDIHEPYHDSAWDYLRLAQNRNGALRLPLDFAYPWGDALAEFRRVDPALRLVNLETAVTDRGEPDPLKGIHYRMNPANLPCLTAAGIDGVSLANNHVLDWGLAGMQDTVTHLRAAGILTTGAGGSEKAAFEPAVFETPHGRILFFGACTGYSGVPRHWAAERQSPGVYRTGLGDRSVRRIAAWIDHYRQAGDRVVLSLHWGANWGYEVDEDHSRFAHRLVDIAGVDVVHGHSSHHPRPIEIYRGRLILYGCGDLLNDYEGIDGEHEEYRGELTALYFPTLGANGALASLELVPMRIHRLRLQHASAEEAAWLAGTLDRESRMRGVRVEPGEGGRLQVRPA